MMKEWQCEICGYIHKGQEPPGQCPSCKSPKEKFAALMAAFTQAAEQPGRNDEIGKPQPTTSAATPMAAATKRRRWRCLVCGHVHEGERPPDKCPVCQAPADQFIELDEKGNPVKKTSAVPPPVKAGIIARIFLSLHIHPILAHFPNGILPMVVLFMAANIFLKDGTSDFIDSSTFYSLIFVLVTMPFVLASGFLEWKKRYRGTRTILFTVKIFCSLLATACLATLVLWRAFDTEVMLTGSPYRLIYFIIAVVMLLAVAMAGHLGGRLVFGSRDRASKGV